MFDLPQPTQLESDYFLDRSNDSLPVVPVTEEKAAWDVILHVLYRHEVPDFMSTDEFKVILETAQKYDLEFITSSIEHVLLCPLRERWDPFAVYAIACAYDLQNVAEHAARSTLKFTLHKLCTRKLHDVPAFVLQRLFIKKVPLKL